MGKNYLSILKLQWCNLFHCWSYFFVAVCLKWLYHNMLLVPYISMESWVLLLLLLCSLMMCANNRIHYGLMVVFICLHVTLAHYLHYAGISEGTELLKRFSGTFWSSVSIINKLSQLYFMQYMELCTQLIHFSDDDCENTCALTY